MGSPTIFSGTFCKLLNSAGILRKNGHILNYDGKRNYIANNHAEVNTTGWSTYADAAGSVPVDATGGAPTTTWTRSTSSPLSGSGSFLLTKDAANRQGEGVSYAFTIDSADKSRQMRIACDLEASAAFVTGDSSDVRIFIYDVTNAALIYPNRYTINSATGRFEAQWDSSSSTSYRLVFHIATTNASAWTLKVDNVICGITEPVFGAAASDWQSYSLTIGGTTTAPTKGTIVRDTAYWRRVGDSIEIRYEYEQSAAGTAGSGDYLFPLPNGYQIDTAKITLNTVNEVICGHAMISNNSSALANASRSGYVIPYNAGNLGLVGSNAHTGTGTNTVVASTFLGLDNANVIYTFYAKVPVVGWSSNVTLANSSTFKISNILANGSRVTAAPTQLGEYRTLIKGAGARTSSDNAPSQTASSMVTDGLRIYSVPMASAGTSGQPNKWEIFVGKNKRIFTEWYSAAARTGNLSVDQHMDNTDANWYGVNEAYDPTTGIMIVNAIPNHTTTNAAVGIGVTEGTGDITGPSDGYFDIVVSENALAVGSANPRSEIWLYGGNGFGSTNTRIRRYTTVGKNVGQAMTLTQSSTNGDSITINEDGIYSILAVDTRNGAGSTQFGISKNSSQLTTGIASITITDVLAINQCNSGDRSKNATVTTILSRGDVIRGHGDASADATANVEVMFRITKISN